MICDGSGGKESGQYAERMIDKGDKIRIFEETSELPVRAVCGGKRAGKTEGKAWYRDEQISWIFCKNSTPFSCVKEKRIACQRIFRRGFV